MDRYFGVLPVTGGLLEAEELVDRLKFHFSKDANKLVFASICDRHVTFSLRLDDIGMCQFVLMFSVESIKPY